MGDCGPHGRGGVLQYVLAIVNDGKIGDIETFLTKQARVRPGTKIGAVLVIDIPKRAFLQDTFNVWCLKNYACVGPCAYHLPDIAHKARYRRDVFQCVSAKNNVS